MPAPLASEIFRPDVLAGQVALVTGGGSGIGFGIAESLGSLGCRIALASRKQERLSKAVDRLAEQGITATAHQLDVRDPERVSAVMQEVRDTHGALHTLVNNAAGNFYAPSEDLSPNAWRSVVEIDLYGTFFCSQAALPHIRDSGGGSIVSVSMTLHYGAWPQMAHAVAAKSGIDALTRTLAVEWAPHAVRVNAVAPGPVPTEGVRKAFSPPPGSSAEAVFAAEEAMLAQGRKGIPLGRWGDPRDIGNAVAFLVSPAGSWITGEILVVDGGEWLARKSGGA
ncbi:MAG TPA: SDR family oxidoreductase [Gemmatimonadales bacterium]|nr:SDR family oxidoreductase [Gemmatimonadales bacterium]